MDVELLTGERYQQFRRDEELVDLLIAVDRSKLADEDRMDIGGLLGVHGRTRSRFDCSLRVLFDHKKIFHPTSEKPVFLDLGFGDGTQVIYAARAGWQAYGIDLSSRCLEVASENVHTAIESGYIPEGLVKIIKGDFFPQDFDHKSRENDDILTSYYETKTLDDSAIQRLSLAGFAPSFRTEIKKMKEESSGVDSYVELGLSLDQVDLFYHYQVERHDRIVRLFSERAKEGAFLLFNRSLGDSPKDYPNVKVVEQAFGSPDTGYLLVLYQKTA